MSRPPIPRAAPSPRGFDPVAGENTYFGLRFADLVALAEALARDPDGVPIPGGSGSLAPGIVEIPGKDRGLARSLIEVPALFAHILGEHQSHYAAESFLGTATQAQSLIRHGRRLAYVPDPGVSATGLAVFEVKDGLSGTLPLNFALQSEPKGDIKSQTYETLEQVEMRAEWNAILPVAARVPTQMVFAGDQITLPLTAPAALDVGDITLLQGQGRTAVCEVLANEPKAITLRRLSADIGPWPAYSAADPYILRAGPTQETRLFGHSADPLSFPPGNVADPALYTTPTSETMRHGYTITGLSSGRYSPGQSLILAETIDPPEPGSLVALIQPDGARVFRVDQVREAAVSFRAGSLMPIPQPDPVPTGFPANQLIEQATSTRATLLDLFEGARAVTWSRFPLDGTLYSGWTDSIPIAPDQPNAAALTATVTLAADLSDMRSGHMVIVTRPSDGLSAAATIIRSEPVSTGWQVILGFDPGASASDFTLGDVMLRANTARVSHGETKNDILGASDGVTPHQKFDLKTPGVTRLLGAEGGVLDLTLRVDGVLWDLVEDFHDATGDSRVARTEFDADQTVTVAFGGEGRGAVPPSGSRNITARYRTGLGVIGDAGAGRLTRIKKSSPLLKSVTNPLPLAGGTDPARPEDMRQQATRPILTFDRAVSLRDHADLALVFPGIARASARWLDRGAVELIAADASGNPPAEPAALRAFLDARRDTEVPLVLLEPQPVDIAISLRVERDRASLADAVRLDVSDRLLSDDPDTPGLFTFGARDFSAPQSLSGLYAQILLLETVTGVEATRFAIAPGTETADILHATDRQWLRLQPSNLVVDVVDPGTLVGHVEGTS